MCCLSGDACACLVAVELSLTALVWITGMTDALPEPGFRSARWIISGPLRLLGHSANK